MRNSVSRLIILVTAFSAVVVVAAAYLHRFGAVRVPTQTSPDVHRLKPVVSQPVSAQSTAIAEAVAALVQEDLLASAEVAEQRLRLVDGRDTSPVGDRVHATRKAWRSSHFSTLQSVEFEFLDVPAHLSPQMQAKRVLSHTGELQANFAQLGAEVGACLEDAAFPQAMPDVHQRDSYCDWRPHGRLKGQFHCFERRLPDGARWTLTLKLDDARKCVVGMTMAYDGPKANLSSSTARPDHSPVRTASGTGVTGYAFGFSIPRYTGILEASIERIGCNVTIDAALLRRLLVPFSGDGASAYEARDVRAKLFPAGEAPIFIDAEGVARQGSTYYQADTKQMDQAFKVLWCPG